MKILILGQVRWRYSNFNGENTNLQDSNVGSDPDVVTNRNGLANAMLL